jgi:hypothetical protein
MHSARIRSTRGARFAGLAIAGCGASKQQVHRARTSGYQTDFARVYSEVLEAVRKRYPQLAEDARAGVIKTSWHPMRITNEGTDDGLSSQQRDALEAQQRSQGNVGAIGGSNLQRKRYFIRFDVHVLGGKPWRVAVRSQASEWELGAVPVELKGADEPHWLKGRTDALYLDIYNRLQKYAVPLKVDEGAGAPKPVAAADLSVYGSIPADAARSVHDVVVAARQRAYPRLRASMIDEFTWSLGGDQSAEQALVMWQADPTVLPALIDVLTQGCVADGATRVVCPAAALTEHYDDYRASFELRGKAWRITSFVRGD